MKTAEESERDAESHSKKKKQTPLTFVVTNSCLWIIQILLNKMRILH